MTRVLPHVDIFVPSIEELLFMLDRPGFESLAGPAAESDHPGRHLRASCAPGGRAQAAGVSAILIKLGDRGAYLRTGARGLAGLTGWADRELYTPGVHRADGRRDHGVG